MLGLGQTGNDLSVTLGALATWLSSLGDSFGWTGRHDDRVCSAFTCLIRRMERGHRRRHEIALSLRLEGQTSAHAATLADASLPRVRVVEIAEMI